DEGGAVRIVLDPLHGRGLAGMRAALEIDVAVGLLVPAATEAHRHAPEIVAPAGADLALGQRLHGLALVELAAVDDHELTQARRDRFECLQSHRFRPLPRHSPVVTSIDWPSARVTIAFFTSERCPRLPRNIFTLPL